MKTSRKIKLTLEQAQEMYGKNESLDKMLLANFPELGVKKVGKWEDLREISGWYVNTSCQVLPIDGVSTDFDSNRALHATEQQALSTWAKPQLSQLMKHVNGDWVADWNTEDDKFVIRRYGNKLHKDIFNETYHFLSFPTAAIRDQFLSDHIELIKTYFEL